MEKKEWREKLGELSFMKGYYFKLEDNGLVEKKDDQLVFNRKDLEDFISSEVEKAEGRGRTMAIHEISKTLDTEITAILPSKITIRIEDFDDFVTSNRNMEVEFISQNKQEIMLQVEKILDAWIALKTVYR